MNWFCYIFIYFFESFYRRNKLFIPFGNTQKRVFEYPPPRRIGRKKPANVSGKRRAWLSTRPYISKRFLWIWNPLPLRLLFSAVSFRYLSFPHLISPLPTAKWTCRISQQLMKTNALDHANITPIAWGMDVRVILVMLRKGYARTMA